MRSLEIWTKMAPEDVLAQAVEFFGPKGAGLRLVKREALAAQFDSPSAAVTVAARPDPEHRRTTVDIVSKELDTDVDRFVKRIVK